MQKKFKQNGFLIKNFEDRSILKNLQKLVKKHFNKKESYYSKMDRSKFSKIALRCQKDIDKYNIMKKFHNSEKEFLNKLIKNDKVLYSSGGYLRVVRPIKKTKKNEYLGWHRETFYSKKKFIHHAINVWIPIYNVEKKNSLRYIAKSHLIPDKKIKRRKYKDPKNDVKKMSAEHKLGFVYSPKKIISGVNFKKEKKFNVLNNQFVSFSALLVHGNGQNNSKKIRFAYNFGILPASKLYSSSNKIDSKNHKYISFN